MIRRKKKALNGSNRRAFAEACNDLATFYYKHNRYSDALDEYKTEASICKELGLQMEWGTCNRMIGEMFMLMAEFDKALKYEERHLCKYTCFHSDSGVLVEILTLNLFSSAHGLWLRLAAQQMF